ncbi:MAG: hypothetical protein E7222_10445 [Clostridiales bacterium]|nr:hypothetical protein [Clostridiales bacterium]
MEKSELFGRLKAVPIKIVFTVILFKLMGPYNVADHGVVLNTLTYALIAILMYGLVSFFGIFYKGGNIIGGTIATIIAMVILVVYMEYAEEGIVKNIILYGICFGGFVLDIISLLGLIGVTRKEKKEAKREAEQQEKAYIQAAMQQQAYQESAIQQQMQRGNSQNDYSADGNALQQMINQFYESEERAKKLFEELTAIVADNDLPSEELKKLAEEHDNIAAVSGVIRERIEQQNYQNSDLVSFRDRYSQCYTDMQVLIKKLESYLLRIKS